MRIAPFILMLIAAGAALAQTAAPRKVEPQALAHQPPRQVTDRWTDTRPRPRAPDLMQQVMIDLQNRARAAVGQPPLAWDAALAADAGAYANELAAKDIFQHARQNPDNPQGENLWMGTRNAFTYAEMVQGWIDERRWFLNGPIPQISSTGNWGDVGHYSQIIWSETTRMGCALASSRTSDYLVCRYSPAGNVYGMTAIPSG